jgi:hypothetical protein
MPFDAMTYSLELVCPAWERFWVGSGEPAGFYHLNRFSCLDKRQIALIIGQRQSSN